MITAICVSAVPPTEIRRQKHLDVFFVTATWYANAWDIYFIFLFIYLLTLYYELKTIILKLLGNY